MSDSSANIISLRNTYQIKVLLEGSKPPIWRRLEVDSRMTLDALHVAIQSSMGWDDLHLHQFIDREDNIFRLQDEDDDFVGDIGMSSIDECQILLVDLLKQEKDWIHYEYDFGDGWSHKITLEKILPFKEQQPAAICAKGRRACPPEDCGGIWQYHQLVELMANPQSDPEEYEDIKEWLGGNLTPEEFDIDAVNDELHELFDGAVFNNKSVFENITAQLDQAYQPSISDNASLVDRSPDSSDEMQEILSSLNETIGVISDLTDMLDECYGAFKKITTLSKDKKVLSIASQMIKKLDE